MPRAQPQESYTTQARVIANTSPKELVSVYVSSGTLNVDLCE
jgi:hypothetical protein